MDCRREKSDKPVEGWQISRAHALEAAPATPTALGSTRADHRKRKLSCDDGPVSGVNRLRVLDRAGYAAERPSRRSLAVRRCAARANGASGCVDFARFLKIAEKLFHNTWCH